MKQILFLFSFYFASNILVAQVDTLMTVDLEVESFVKPNGFTIKKIEIDSILTRNRLSDVLEKEPSVFIKQYGPGSLSTLSVRGTSSSQSQVFWNGIPMSSITLGQVNLNLIRPMSSNSMHMVMGGGESGSYPGAIGASIYLKNDHTFQNQKKIIYSTSYGDFETYRQSGLVGLSNTKKSLMFSWNSSKSSNNFKYYNTFVNSYLTREKSNQNSLDFSLHAAIKLNSHSFIKTNILFSESIKEIPRPISINMPVQNQIQDDYSRLFTLAWQKDINNKHIKIQWGNQKLNTLFHDLASSNDESIIKTDQNFIQFRYKNNVFTKGQILLSWDSEISSAESGGFSSTKYNDLHFMNIGYIHNFSSKFKTSVNIKPIKNKLNKIDYLKSLALNYSINNKTNIYGHVNTSVRYPTLNDLYWENGGNFNLKPEKSLQYELGFNKTKETFYFQSNLYLNNVDNWILWQPQTSGVWQPDNVFKVISYGFEFATSKNWTFNNNNQFKTQVSYHYNSTKNESSKHDLIYSPRSKWSYSLSYRCSNFKMTWSGQYSSSYFISTDNTFFMPKYLIHNISVSKSINFNSVNIKMNLAVNNVFNVDYQIVANNPMPRQFINFGIICSKVTQ